MRYLIDGLKASICDDCAMQAGEIVRQSLNVDKPAAKPVDMKKVPKPVEIKEYLDQYIIGQDDAKRTLAVAV